MCVHVNVCAGAHMPEGAAGISRPRVLPTSICNSNERAWGIWGGRGSTPLLCVSSEAIILHAHELPQSCLVDFSVAKKHRGRIFSVSHISHSLFCVYCCSWHRSGMPRNCVGVTLMLLVMMPRRATGSVCVFMCVFVCCTWLSLLLAQLSLLRPAMFVAWWLRSCLFLPADLQWPITDA